MSPTPPEPEGASAAVLSTPGSTGFRADQLEGFRVGVTSDRRSEDLITALERRGAEVLHAPTIRIAPTEDDAPLVEDTNAIVAARPDILLATTSYGMRRWFEVADASGLGEALTAVLAETRILVRGPKARGSIRAAGLNDSGMSDRETTASLVDAVLAGPHHGLTVAMQLHGFTDGAQIERLRAAGMTVLTVAPYRWVLPEGPQRVHRLIEAVCSGGMDAVTFTSAPAVDALFSAADSAGRLDDVIAAFRGPVVAAAVGHVTAKPLVDVGISPLIPERFRMGALIRLVCEHLENERVQRVTTRHGEMVLRGRCVDIGGVRAPLPPNLLALFRMLVESQGGVVSRTALLAALPEVQDEHAIDVAISRLRSALPASGVVATVVKRGYRLDV
ncbi:uroporphyrinogen-III synthase [Planctomonas psychrotolerans]|uniref:uroporphyrinogen-III synthase n=1 Tax=Planctomonas psychrotolerans TaxID=2528712 RepID=UPI001239CA75|nr:uroporphyrinogen-III synthase [Planctomonas psychrotolerans]